MGATSGSHFTHPHADGRPLHRSRCATRPDQSGGRPRRQGTHAAWTSSPGCHTAEVWVSAVAQQLGTEDRHYACRGLRAWLHTVRDRVTVDGAAHFAAQPPMLLRGLFFDGWTPS
ncbi:MAG: DUF2267 domain-containing protein, partial [Pseudonocardia sp.]|nr:DUF2267 domain-containing protein [Pseudonocardia sp.]